MINRRIVLYVVALATLVAIVLGLLGLSGPAVAVLAVAVAGMFGWVVLWARAQNAQLARIGAALERRESVDRERNDALAAGLGGLGARMDTGLATYAEEAARRSDGLDQRIQRTHREVLEVASLLQRTPSTTNELYRVYRRLVHHDHPMPVLGGWAMTSSTLVWITDQISSGHVSTIVECGSGSSTVWFALALEQRGGEGRIVSLESNPAYADETRSRLAELGLGHRALVLTAPLVPLELPERETQRWFDHAELPDDLTGADLLFVDGPVGSTTPLARYPALPVLADRLTDDAYVVLDDSSRRPEQEILQLWTGGRHAGRRYRIVHELDRATVLRADAPPAMLWADRSRGKPYAKDPSVVWFGGRYLMYFSIPPRDGDSRWGQAVAASDDLENWRTVAEIEPAGEVEATGICAGGAIVLGDRVHLFYQTYGQGRSDAICHAWSTDGVTFERTADNPIIRPSGDWTCGRAIDAEVQVVGDELFCYWATRDADFRHQLLGVHSAPLDSDFSARHWRQRCTDSILSPQLPWETGCIEAPAVCRRDDTYVMFYAGGFNNEPQQIGVASSPDGLRWTRMSDEPFLTNGRVGDWNSSESGHPAVFVDPNDGVTWLFFQGNDDHGATWYLSRRRIEWDGHVPRLA